MFHILLCVNLDFCTDVMPGPATDLVRRALQNLDPSVFGLCYDSSHDQIDGPRPFDLIGEFDGRIFTVHLSIASSLMSILSSLERFHCLV